MSTRSKTRTTRRKLLIALATLAPGLAACTLARPSPGSLSETRPTQLAPTSETRAGGTVVFGAVSEARSLNPVVAIDSASPNVQELIFEPLVKLDQTGP